MAVLLRGVVWVGLLAGLLSVARGDESATVQDEGAGAKSLQRMQARVASLKMERGDEETRKRVALVEAPVLRYSNPEGLTVTTDGAVWVWGKTGRPVAINAIFFQQFQTGEWKWSCELTSLTDEPLSLRSRAGWEWKPAKSELRWVRFPDSSAGTGAVTAGTAVAGTVMERTRQMKELARQFMASETFNDSQTDQLRLLIRPLHRYADPERGLVDGALFAFTSGTNPEVLLLLEARRGEGTGEAAWHFAFARMGAAVSHARLGENVVWECPAIEKWDDSEPYFSSFGTDQAVFDHESDRP